MNPQIGDGDGEGVGSQLRQRSSIIERHRRN
jgi:hypothetical protein